MLLKQVSRYLYLSNTTTSQSCRWSSIKTSGMQDVATNDDKKTSDFKDILDDGPQLGDFIAGVVPRGQKWAEYDGKLKRDKGDNER